MPEAWASKREKDPARCLSPHIGLGNYQLKPLSLGVLLVQLVRQNKEGPSDSWLGAPTTGLPLNKDLLVDPTASEALGPNETHRDGRGRSWGLESTAWMMKCMCCVALGWPFNLSEPMK